MRRDLVAIGALATDHFDFRDLPEISSDFNPIRTRAWIDADRDGMTVCALRQASMPTIRSSSTRKWSTLVGDAAFGRGMYTDVSLATFWAHYLRVDTRQVRL